MSKCLSASSAPETLSCDQFGDPQRVLTPAQVKRLGQWGPSRRKLLKRAWQKDCTPREAIKLQCLDCCGEDEAAITECSDRCCPLWRFRPFQRRLSSSKNAVA
jgi:hypothetical protein